MPFCYTLVQLSSENPSLITDRNRHREPSLDHMQRVRDFEILSLKRHVSIKSLPSELREPCRRGGRKSARVRGNGEHKGKESFYINRMDELRNPQKLRQRAQVLHRSAPDGVLELKGELDIHPIPNPEVTS